jgi:hypothetical protein
MERTNIKRQITTRLRSSKSNKFQASIGKSQSALGIWYFVPGASLPFAICLLVFAASAHTWPPDSRHEAGPYFSRDFIADQWYITFPHALPAAVFAIAMG